MRKHQVVYNSYGPHRNLQHYNNENFPTCILNILFTYKYSTRIKYIHHNEFIDKHKSYGFVIRKEYSK